MLGKMGIVIKDVCQDGIRILGGALVKMFMKAGILFGGIGAIIIHSWCSQTYNFKKK